MKRMTTVLTCMFLAVACVQQANAAAITWDAAFDVSGPNDIDISGTHVNAISAGGGAVDNIVNANGENIEFTSVGVAPLGTLSAEMLPSNGDGSPFQNVLNTVSFGEGPTDADFDLTGLTSGQEYQVQVFFVDTRTCCNTRTMVYGSSGGNSTTVAALGSGLGQTAIGTFTADDIFQTITINTAGTAGNSHINAYVVREVPEPSSILLLVIGVIGAAFFHKKQKNNLFTRVY